MAEVRLYTTTWCGYCVLLKRYLNYHGIAYDEIDIEADEAVAERLERWTGGYRTVPTVQIGDAILVNPKGKEVAEELERFQAGVGQPQA